MISISHEILIQHYDMYLVCCEIFLKFLKFLEGVVGRTNFWYPGPWLLWKWLCNMWWWAIQPNEEGVAVCLCSLTATDFLTLQQQCLLLLPQSYSENFLRE